MKSEAIYDIEPKLGTNARMWKLLRTVAMLMPRLFEQTALSKGHNGLTLERSQTLTSIVNLGEKATTAELSRITGLRNQSLTGLLNRMEVEGLIVRNPKHKGQPFTLLRLTDKGQEVKAAGEQVMADVMATTAEATKAEAVVSLLAVRDALAEALHMDIIPAGE